MKIKDIMEVLNMLARSQGFYGRLVRSIEELQTENPFAYDELVYILESQNFNNTIDVVLYFEC